MYGADFGALGPKPATLRSWAANQRSSAATGRDAFPKVPRPVGWSCLDWARVCKISRCGGGLRVDEYDMNGPKCAAGRGERHPVLTVLCIVPRLACTVVFAVDARERQGLLRLQALDLFSDCQARV